MPIFEADIYTLSVGGGTSLKSWLSSFKTIQYSLLDTMLYHPIDSVLGYAEHIRSVLIPATFPRKARCKGGNIWFQGFYGCPLYCWETRVWWTVFIPWVIRSLYICSIRETSKRNIELDDSYRSPNPKHLLDEIFGNTEMRKATLAILQSAIINIIQTRYCKSKISSSRHSHSGLWA